MNDRTDSHASPQSSLTIGFIGLGNMGAPMARNLHRAGHAVRAFDLSPQALEHARTDGLQVVGSAPQAAVDVDILITMLPASRHVESLYLGQDGQAGLLDELASSTLVIDSSTIAAATAVKVAEAARRRGVVMLGAPVSGGRAVPPPER